MKNLVKKKIAAFLLLAFATVLVQAQIRILDGFDSEAGWNFIRSDAVNLKTSVDKGISGNAIRFDYDFTKGTGYGGIQKFIHVDVPDNYEFTFYVKADSPANNFEIKFIDSTGNNVWWVSNRNYDFPREWKKIHIKKRHISFAWGPTNEQNLKRIDRIEFTIASFVGGKGTVWLDDLKFEPLPAETNVYPTPQINASFSIKNHSPKLITDNSDQTFWKGTPDKNQQLYIDFKTRREFGGLQINWLRGYSAKSFDILSSTDGKTWEKMYDVNSNSGDVSFIRMPESEARYLKINLLISNSTKGFGIRELKFLDIKSSLAANDFLIYTAKNSPVGNYPAYFLEQATYWTITGVNNDVKEALINEYGMVEVDKGLFSIEPMIKTGGELYNWSNVKCSQSMGNTTATNFDFVPTATWQFSDLTLETGVTASGEANKNSQLLISYTIQNNSDTPKDFELYLLIRPFQVNPYYQFLNLTGGAGRIKFISQAENGCVQVDDKIVVPSREYDSFGATTFDEGNLVEMLRNGKMPTGKSATDEHNLANGVMKFMLHLAPRESTKLYVTVPFYEKKSPGNIDVSAEFGQASEFWKNKVGYIKFNLPASADRIINTYRSNLAYILVNRDKAGIQPGSRSYERSWIRDGALTSSALMKSGIVTEVRDFINWYTDHQFENGKVPCVVDFRGPDPVPENDSHGEMIYLIREYFNFTHDTAFLQSKNEHVLKAVDYMESLVKQRLTDEFKNGNDSVRACYGLMPESISHEGYSAKPMHSYWDDFFTMKGLKDAADIQHILGETQQYQRICKIRDAFKENLYNSLNLAMKYKNINYIPGCVELGDFDATSTTIALTPCNERNNLPKPQVYNTFDKYYEYFKNRRDGKIEWINYTPYENRLIGSFIMLDQPERAHELIEFLLNDQRPQGWNHWAEVVWHDYRTPRYIGDMPHTWCGSDFLNAIRSMFVYENEWDQSLVLASALYQDWIDAPGGMSIENLPTYYGEISYSVKNEGNTYKFSITGDAKLPANGIKIENFNGSKLPLKVTVNGQEITAFNTNEISVSTIPAEVEIYY